MTDLPSPDPAGQGPGARYRFTLPEHDFPDTTVEWWEAVGVPPDAGSRVQFLDADGAVIAAFAVGYAVMRMGRFPDAEIWAIRLENGLMAPSLRILRDGATIGMLLGHIQEMIERYEAVLGPTVARDGEAGALVKVVPREPHQWPLSDYLPIWREVRPRHRSHIEITRAMANRLGVNERTIRRWPGLYGYPLFETVEEYDARVGQVWTFPGHDDGDVQG